MTEQKVPPPVEAELAAMDRVAEHKVEPDSPRDPGEPRPSRELIMAAANDRGPVGVKARDKLFEMSAHFAVRMELGEYVDKTGKRWDPAPFKIGEILLRLGYGKGFIGRGARPAWWPGMGDFRRYVAFLKATREVDYAQSYQQTRPIVETIFVSAAVELADRLMDPRKRAGIGNRELVEMFTKMQRSMAQMTPGGPVPLAPSQMSEGGSVVYQSIQNVILKLPEGPARDHATAMFERVLREGADSLPKPKDVIEAKAS